MTAGVVLIAITLSDAVQLSTAEGEVIEVRHLTSADSIQREHARQQLVLAGPAAVPALVRAYLIAPLPLQHAIGDVVAEIGLPAFEPVYLESRGRSTELSIKCIELAVAIGPVAIPLAKQKAETVGPDAGYARLFGQAVLVRAGPIGLKALADTLASLDPAVRSESVNTLAASPSDAVPPLMKPYLRSSDLTVRGFAIGIYGRQKSVDAEFMTLIEEGLSDPDLLVRMESAASIGRHFERKYARPVAALARADPNALVRNSASAALRRQIDPLALRLGHRYLHEPMAYAKELATEGTSIGLRIGTVCGLVFAFILIRSPSTASDRLTTLACMALAGLMGLWWGGLATGMRAYEENSVLLHVGPAAAALSLFFCRRVLAEPRGWRSVAGSVLQVFVPFYAAFGIGLAWVWGYLGF